jgi:methionyl-tRNA formyltransferase
LNLECPFNQILVAKTSRRGHKSHHRRLLWSVRASQNSEICRVRRPECPSVTSPTVSSPKPPLWLESSFGRFRGPAPLQHTILSGTEKTGITLQTLDDKSFDHGIILAQTPDPFLAVPNLEYCTYHELLHFISPKAASMLVQGLRDLVFIPPLQAVGLSTIEDDRINPPGYRIKNATKITPEDRKVSFLDWGGDRIYRHYRALGRLWTDVSIDAKTTKRLIFEDITLVDRPDITWTQSRENTEIEGENMHPRAPHFIVASIKTDTWRPLLYIEDGDGVIFDTINRAIRVGRITVEGQSKKAASKALHSLQPEIAWRLVSVAEQTSQDIREQYVVPVKVD